MGVSEEILHILSKAKVDFFSTYPCAKFQQLFNLVNENFNTVGVTKEEEGVGLCAGASLAGVRPAMLIQSTGIGNMINALCSLTKTFNFPLLILASWRGIYQEKISAQIPLGKSLPGIFDAVGIQYSIVEKSQDLPQITAAVRKAYDTPSIQVVLLSPRLWVSDKPVANQEAPVPMVKKPISVPSLLPLEKGSLTRYQALKIMKPFLTRKLVVGNIGFPSRELYDILDQSSNFYMLGSLGLATPIGLGLAMHSPKPVVVIDGDGSLLSNLGSLATIAETAPKNLTIMAIDNAVHGSTGNQPTATGSVVDLAKTANALGIEHVYRVNTPDQLNSVLSTIGQGPNFIHITTKAGNEDVPVIPLTPEEIKIRFMKAVAAT